MVKIIQTGPLSVNSAVVTLCKNKVFVVDPATNLLSADEKKISSYLEQNKLDLVAIVLTHGHFDHVAGLAFLKRVYPNVPVLIHQGDACMIGEGSEDVQARMLSYVGFLDFLPSVSDLPNPDCFLEDGKNLYDCLGDSFCSHYSVEAPKLKTSMQEWKILHTPGHTNGSICLYNQNKNVLISGDTLFYGSWGRTDLGGSDEMIFKSLACLKKEVSPEAIVYPGHNHFGFMMKENYL